MQELKSKSEIDPANLIETINLKEEDTYLYLSDESTKAFAELTKEWKNAKVFAAHKLNIRNKILLYGESGNGKTTVAKFLARRMQIPMYQVRHEQILSSYIGSTARNIAQLFELVETLVNEETHCILFFDEIDSLTMRRDGDERHQAADEEYNKALNVLLIKIERMHRNVIFIGATNRKDAMDAAVIRRFDLLHKLPAPQHQEKLLFAKRQIEYYNIDVECEEGKLKLAEALELESYSDIKRALIALVRKQILAKIK